MNCSSSLANDPRSPEHALAAKVKLAEMKFTRKEADIDALLSDILRSDNRNVTAMRIRASIRLDRGQLDLAISDLRKALNDQPGSPELLFLLATAYERNGSIELSDKLYASATKASNFNIDAGLNYVAFLRRRGNIQRAEEFLAELADRHPNNVAILSASAEIKLSRQNWTGAQEISEAMRRIGDPSGIADQILGAALSGQNKYDESIAAFQRAAAAAPTTPQPMVSLIAALVYTKQTDKAVAFLQEVLRSNPGNDEAHVLLGSLRLANNEPDQAVKSFKTAIEKEPKNIAGYRALANLYTSQKNNEAALEVIRAGLRQQPNSVVLHIDLAGILGQRGDYEEAMSEYENILTLQPGSLIAANNLASMLSDHRTDKASLERSRSLAAILRDSPEPQFKDTLGWVSYRRGDFKNAVPLLEAAAAALPDQALVHYHLGMGYAAISQPTRASGEFLKALTKAPNGELTEAIIAALKKSETR